jgi:hypothetical protein
VFSSVTCCFFPPPPLKSMDGFLDDAATQDMDEAPSSEDDEDNGNHALRFANDPRVGGQYCLGEKGDPRVGSILGGCKSQHAKLIATVGMTLSDARHLVRTPAQLQAALDMENAQPEFRNYSETHAISPKGLALRDLRKLVESGMPRRWRKDCISIS